MSFLEKAWYKKATWLYFLLPLSWVFQILASLRRKLQSRAAARESVTVPIIVVGNISAGGTGKTPVLIALARHLKEQGFRPGIISRGYKAGSRQFPLLVNEINDAAVTGDEPALIARQTDCPVVIDPERLRACRFLLEQAEVDVILSDDGLQHYRLPRDIEIAVIDGQRLFGNGLCFPAGPLREPPSRLKTVDYCIVNGEPEQLPAELAGCHIMQLRPRFLVNLASGDRRPFSGAPFKLGNRVQAVTGIGNPERFFNLLKDLPYPVQSFPFPDHHPFCEEDFTEGAIDPAQPIVMTEKDGIKCKAFARDNFWELQADVVLPEVMLQEITRRIKGA